MSAMTPADALEVFLTIPQFDLIYDEGYYSLVAKVTAALAQADRLRELVALGEAVEGMPDYATLWRVDDGRWFVEDECYYYHGEGSTPLAALKAAKERET